MCTHACAVLQAGMAKEMDMVAISAEPISQHQIVSFVTDASAGGISLFIGE